MDHGFRAVREQEIPELATTARLYRHDPTGAELLALLADEPNMSFGVSFRTLPQDDTGVAHILEHIVLAGSRAYPLKDPFFELAKSSLASFLNAFTSPDKTTYPFATENEQDFFNLLDVYLDAVFHPRLEPRTFQQEAWHHELEDGEAGGGEATLVYRGVVFNEMKGALAAPDRALSRATLGGLFPDTVYRHESGGDPAAIPDLTHEDLVAFHRAHYHPANARFFLYGAVPLETTLARIDRVLRGAATADAPPPVELQPPFEAPREATAAYPAGEGAKAFASVAWALPETDDPAEAFALEVLADALLGTPGAPLRKALIDSGLGEAVVGGLGAGLRQPTFSAGLRGVPPERAGEVAPLVLATLERLADEGLAEGAIAAARNTLEFGLRENDAFGGQRGIVLGLRALGRWLHGGDPLALLAFEAPLAELDRRLAADPRHLEGLMRRHLLDNPHRLQVRVRPDPELLARRDADERARLERELAGLDAAARDEIRAAQRELRAHQEAPDPPEALAALPYLRRADLEAEPRRTPAEGLELAGVPVRRHPLATNGIVYLDLGLDLRALPAALLPYAAVFGRALLETGTRDRDLTELTQRIGRETGGIRPELVTAPALGGGPGPVRLFLRGKALADRAGALADILREVLLEARLDDRERLRRIVREEKARREAALVPQGHAYALRRLAAHAHDAGWAEEQIQGLAGLGFVRRLEDRIEGDWDAVAADLELVRAALVARDALAVGATADDDAWGAARPALEGLLEALPRGGGARPGWDRAALPPREGFSLPAQVQYVGQGLGLAPDGAPLPGWALAVARHLGADYLLPRIRLQGGAYGAGAVLDPVAGTLAYYSYRDPNLLATLDAYAGAPAELRRAEPTDAALDKLVVGALGRLDPYALPGARGFRALRRHLAGLTDEHRARRREELLGTERRHFRELADRIEAAGEARLAILGGREALEAADRERGGGWLELERAL